MKRLIYFIESLVLIVMLMHCAEKAGAKLFKGYGISATGQRFSIAKEPTREEMLRSGMSFKSLVAEGFNGYDVHRMGITKRDLLAAGLTEQEIRTLDVMPSKTGIKPVYFYEIDKHNNFVPYASTQIVDQGEGTLCGQVIEGRLVVECGTTGNWNCDYHDIECQPCFGCSLGPGLPPRDPGGPGDCTQNCNPPPAPQLDLTILNVNAGGGTNQITPVESGATAPVTKLSALVMRVGSIPNSNITVTWHLANRLSNTPTQANKIAQKTFSFHGTDNALFAEESVPIPANLISLRGNYLIATVDGGNETDDVGVEHVIDESDDNNNRAESGTLELLATTPDPNILSCAGLPEAPHIGDTLSLSCTLTNEGQPMGVHSPQTVTVKFFAIEKLTGEGVPGPAIPLGTTAFTAQFSNPFTTNETAVLPTASHFLSEPGSPIDPTVLQANRQYEISAVVDPDNHITEPAPDGTYNPLTGLVANNLNSKNVHLMGTVVILAAPPPPPSTTPDLVFKKVTISYPGSIPIASFSMNSDAPTEVPPDTIILFTSKIKNGASNTATSVLDIIVKIQATEIKTGLPPVSLNVGGSLFAQILGPGQEAASTFSIERQFGVSNGFQPGEVYEITATLDPANLHNETGTPTGESNNVKSLGFVKIAGVIPNLRIEPVACSEVPGQSSAPAGASIFPATILHSAVAPPEVNICVKIRNKGDGDAVNFPVEILAKPSVHSEPISTIALEIVPFVPAHSSITHMITANLLAGSPVSANIRTGDQDITLKVNRPPLNPNIINLFPPIPESDGTDNEKIIDRAFFVAAPDLQLTLQPLIDYSFAENGVRVPIRVKNTGHATSNAAKCKLRIYPPSGYGGDIPSEIVEVAVSSIGAGGFQDIEVVFPGFRLPLSYSIADLVFNRPGVTSRLTAIVDVENSNIEFRFGEENNRPGIDLLPPHVTQ